MAKIKLTNYEHLAEMMEDTLIDEIAEVECAISNERLWEKGSDGEQADQHGENVTDLEEWKAILQYAVEHGVIAYDKEIHSIWVKNLLHSFIEELEGMIDNEKCMMLDTTMEEDIIEAVKEILSEEFNM